MTFNKRQFINALRLYKDGAIIGGVVGAAAAYYLVSQGIGLTEIATSGKGLIDSFLGRSTPVTQLAAYKLYGTFISLGAILGFYADMLIHRYNLHKIF